MLSHLLNTLHHHQYQCHHHHHHHQYQYHQHQHHFETLELILSARQTSQKPGEQWDSHGVADWAWPVACGHVHGHPHITGGSVAPAPTLGFSLPTRPCAIAFARQPVAGGPQEHAVQRAQGVILAPYGPEWREQRRFSVSTLRNLGLGKKPLEQWVTDEAGHLCDAFKDQAGRPFNPSTLLNKAVCNVITSLIFARRFEYEDANLIRMLRLLEEALTNISGFIPEILNTFPVLLHIPGLFDKVFSGQKTFAAIVDNLLTENRRTWDPEQPPRGLTDAFLAEMEKAKGNPESSFNDQNLRMVVNDLFIAGTVSTSTTLSWALLFMIQYPDVQRRVQQEIDDILGPGRSPEMADQARMPYTNAVIHEVQRFADIAPLNLPCITSRDIEVQGFLIPKGTTLITNLSSVLKDETVWEKPLHFHPEHFLDAQGCFVKQEAFMPFSAGRRACLGEPLARMELFLFFTCLLQHFSFSVPAGQPRPSDHVVLGVLKSPAPYQLCAVPR
ncbi:cytochrome P450 2D28 isoform X3 [Mesocricetus auratus]|uniref:Cytochrome P450 n=1 Tax=Mesocricetus auratus TaxID=10036 RepID=A0ABM2Y1U5_MESAU|nr:cytochrome P450 2D28 isoform X3 [Mesocricetus auratus]